MERSLNAVAEKPVQADCRHHWIIETANGPVSKGICKLCGAKRNFENLYYGYGQTDEPSKPTNLFDLVDMEDDFRGA